VSIQLSRRVQRVKPSPTMAATARAARLKAEGRDIISLTAGEPDFATPVEAAEAGIAAIRDGATRYTDVGGTAELKQAICDKLAADNHLHYSRAQILVADCNHSRARGHIAYGTQRSGACRHTVGF
jgi:aspartate aminotransferase